jgi:hypothetical protein
MLVEGRSTSRNIYMKRPHSKTQDRDGHQETILQEFRPRVSCHHGSIHGDIMAAVPPSAILGVSPILGPTHVKALTRGR